MKNMKSAENSKKAIKNTDFCGWVLAPEGRRKNELSEISVKKKHCPRVRAAHCNQQRPSRLCVTQNARGTRNVICIGAMNFIF